MMIKAMAKPMMMSKAIEIVGPNTAALTPSAVQ
jgi:hypothetical protein